MKKYQQLLLAVISIFSCICLLIYRHKYNQLHYVLEVLNFFGTPGVTTLSPTLCLHNSTLQNFVIPDPAAAWQRVSNSLYIYSAYWEKDEDKQHVKSFAVGVLNENIKYGCYLWYDSDPRTRMGKFSVSGLPIQNQDPYYVSKINGKTKTKAYVFYCEVNSTNMTPVGVTFYKTGISEVNQGFLSVVSLKNSPPVPNSVGICVMPAAVPSFMKSVYLEFLSFHKLIGVNDYLIYGGNDQYNLLSLIQAVYSYDIHLTITHWNYPFSGDQQIMKAIAENDCITRTKGVFENVIILEWNKFLVPGYLFTIDTLLKELDHGKKIYKFQFSTMLFCTEYQDNVKANSSSPLILKKTRYSLPKFDSFLSVYRPHLHSGQSQKYGKELASVHHYTSCRNIRIKSGSKKSDRVDDAMFRYQKDLQTSLLLRI